MAEERKLVTVVFADVSGSTALGESLDPEDMRALMGRYYEHARRIVADYGGTLEKFIGDAVMAVFGLPQAHSNDAERALAAAQALRDAVAADRVLGGRLLLRVGVNTGDVIATTDPTLGDFLITGDAVNVAARLQQTAAPGEILASERTAAAAQASFLFGDAGVAAYRKALEYLRAGAQSDPLVGARLLRKMLVIIMRWRASTSERPSREELVSLRAEARRLAEAAGDEYELWRVRTVNLFWPFWSSEVDVEEAQAQMAVGLEAAAYFKARGDWEAFTEALDAYSALARDTLHYEDSLAANRRRMAARGLSAMERSDALAMLVCTLTESGDYMGAVENARWARPT